MNVRVIMASARTAWQGVFAALVFALTLFAAIDSYAPPTPWYNLAVAELLFQTSAALGLWAAFGAARLNPDRRWRWLILAIAASATVSAVFSAHQFESLLRLKLYAACALFGFLFHVVVRDHVRQALVPVLLAVAAIHAIFLSELVFSHYLATDAINTKDAATHYFAHIRHFGYFGFLAACAAAGVVFLGGQFRAIGFLLCLAAVYGLIQFGSRGALLAWLLFVAMVAVLATGRRRWLLACIAAVGLAVAAVAVVDSTRPVENRLQHSIIKRQTTGEDSFGTTQGRIDIWRDSLARIAQRPLFGHGPEGYRLSACCLQGTTQPHNALVQALFEFGIIGTALQLIAAVMFFAPALRQLIDGARRGSVDGGLLVSVAMAFAFIAFSMVDGLFYHAIPLLHFALLAALIGALSGNRDGAQNGQ
jgi:O-antigen ligase